MPNALTSTAICPNCGWSGEGDTGQYLRNKASDFDRSRFDKTKTIKPTQDPDLQYAAMTGAIDDRNKASELDWLASQAEKQRY